MIKISVVLELTDVSVYRNSFCSVSSFQRDRDVQKSSADIESTDYEAEEKSFLLLRAFIIGYGTYKNKTNRCVKEFTITFSIFFYVKYSKLI